MTKRYVPKHPTAGWLYSECERLGLSCRGTDIQPADMARWLREHHGYDVTAGGEPKRKADR